jgi:hypothetical protein
MRELGVEERLAVEAVDRGEAGEALVHGEPEDPHVLARLGRVPVVVVQVEADAAVGRDEARVALVHRRLDLGVGRGEEPARVRHVAEA